MVCESRNLGSCEREPLATAAAPKPRCLSELAFTQKLLDASMIHFALRCFVRELGLVAALAVSQPWGCVVSVSPRALGRGAPRPKLIRGLNP